MPIRLKLRTSKRTAPNCQWRDADRAEMQIAAAVDRADLEECRSAVRAIEGARSINNRVLCFGERDGRRDGDALRDDDRRRAVV